MNPTILPSRSALRSSAALFLLATAPFTAPAAQRAPREPDPVDRMAEALEPSREVVYKRIDGRDLHLVLFEPAGRKPGDRRACFVTIHGGGWSGLAPRRMYPFAADFARRGMLGISVEYRLARTVTNGDAVVQVTPYDCVRDARSALRYVRAHATDLGIDPHRIVAHGGSAGGHLAAATALFDGYDEPGEDAAVSCVPDALVLLFPVIDTSTNGYGHARLGERWREISPLHHVRPGVPPTLIFHGTGDVTTPFAGAKAFTEAMAAAGNRCELVVHEGGAHGYLMRDQALYDETERRTEAFLASLGFLGARSAVSPVPRADR